MKKNRKKEYLLQAKLYRIREEHEKRELHELRLKMDTVKAIEYNKMRVETSLRQESEVEELAILLATQEKKYKESIIRYRKKREEIVESINRMTDPRFIAILYRRYIIEQSWETIAKEVGYTEDWVKHMHGSALAAFKIPT